mmetsp:Transcript_48844/g.106349  ORF Transcript_48844/g.106349 Transcript_48844/m.106349 type:complete len:277 (-) Transcript_48844:1781-2611(-)
MSHCSFFQCSNRQLDALEQGRMFKSVCEQVPDVRSDTWIEETDALRRCRMSDGFAQDPHRLRTDSALISESKINALQRWCISNRNCEVFHCVFTDGIENETDIMQCRDASDGVAHVLGRCVTDALDLKCDTDTLQWRQHKYCLSQQLHSFVTDVSKGKLDTLKPPGIFDCLRQRRPRLVSDTSQGEINVSQCLSVPQHFRQILHRIVAEYACESKAEALERRGTLDQGTDKIEGILFDFLKNQTDAIHGWSASEGLIKMSHPWPCASAFEIKRDAP